MNAEIVSILSILLVTGVTEIRGQIFCRDDLSNDQIIELVCSGKNLDDGNYWDALNATFYETEVLIRANNSLDQRSVAFYVENNRIETLKILPFMPTVAVLSFKNNRLVGCADGTFHKLPHLKHLDLSRNSLTGITLTKYMFRGKQNKALSLEHLNLAYNSISSLREDLFSYLTNLISLDLGHNPLSFVTEETIKAISQLKKLQMLSLAQTQLTHLADVFFIKIAVRSLFLNGNFFAEVPRGLRHVGDRLEYLNLNDNPIHEIDSQSFVGLSKLRELHLNAMDALASIREHAFSPLHSLSILRCSYNPLLSFVHPKAFHELKRGWNVKEIFLDDNNLRFLAKETFELEKLSMLSIRGNPWNCTCSLRWLYQYVREREKHDPEANIGIRCKYPEKLFKRWLANVDKMLRCNETTEIRSNDHFNGFDLVSTRTCLIILMAFSLFLLASFLCLVEMRRKMNAFDRQLGTRISTAAKYRRAQLGDNDEILDTSEND